MRCADACAARCASRRAQQVSLGTLLAANLNAYSLDVGPTAGAALVGAGVRSAAAEVARAMSASMSSPPGSAAAGGGAGSEGGGRVAARAGA
jgi:hypothetical protein